MIFLSDSQGHKCNRIPPAGPRTFRARKWSDVACTRPPACWEASFSARVSGCSNSSGCSPCPRSCDRFGWWNTVSCDRLKQKYYFKRYIFFFLTRIKLTISVFGTRSAIVSPSLPDMLAAATVFFRKPILNLVATKSRRRSIRVTQTLSSICKN